MLSPTLLVLRVATLFLPQGLVLVGLLVASGLARAGDWPMWCGPNCDGTSAETNLIDRWNPRGPGESHLLWKNDQLAGRSTPIVMGGKLYMLLADQPGTPIAGEKVVCADAATGEILWEHRLSVFQTEVPEAHVGRSSVVGDPESGQVYALGVCGYFCCLSGETGKMIWDRSLHEEFGFQIAVDRKGGTSFPLVYDDTVLVSGGLIGWGNTPKWGSMAKPAHRWMGWDKRTGELRWISGTRLFPYDLTYSPPTLAMLGGQRALVFSSGDGAVGAIQPGTGKLLWKHPASHHGSSRHGPSGHRLSLFHKKHLEVSGDRESPKSSTVLGRAISASPIVDSNSWVYTGHSEENLADATLATGAFVAIDGALPTGEKIDKASMDGAPGDGPRNLTDPPLWKKSPVMVGKSSPLMINGRIYVLTDSAVLLILDAKTGDEIARKTLGQAMHGSPLYADGKIYVCTKNGKWWVLRPTAEGVEVVDQTTLSNEQVEASPIVADGRVYLTTHRATYCLANPIEDSPIPNEVEPARRRKIKDKRVTQAHLVPYDAILAPGKKIPYRVRLYNAAGDFIREAAPEKVSFGVAGPGKVTAEGVYKAPSKAGHQAALILCEVAGLSAEARLRIVPPLPWNFDFEGKNSVQGKNPVPLIWIGGRPGYEARESSKGNHYLAKLVEPSSQEAEAATDPTSVSTSSVPPLQKCLWMGPPTLSNYTLQADIQLRESVAEATEETEVAKLPSVGLINSRYTFALLGSRNEVRLTSWRKHARRTQAVVSKRLKAGVWYRMKLSVVPSREEKTCTVQAKVWRRGKAEPGAWTLELTDKAPNLQGSPGLFGDTKNAEFYVDNVIVTTNE